jgi:hypothetical protein
MTDLGPRFVAALAAKDTDGLVALFASEVDFRGMTPGRFGRQIPPSELSPRCSTSGSSRRTSSSALTMSRLGMWPIGNASTTASWSATPTARVWSSSGPTSMLTPPVASLTCVSSVRAIGRPRSQARRAVDVGSVRGWADSISRQGRRLGSASERAGRPYWHPPDRWPWPPC